MPASSPPTSPPRLFSLSLSFSRRFSRFQLERSQNSIKANERTGSPSPGFGVSDYGVRRAPESSREKRGERGEATQHGAYISGDRVEILSEQRDRLVPIEKAIKRG